MYSSAGRNRGRRRTLWQKLLHSGSWKNVNWWLRHICSESESNSRIISNNFPKRKIGIESDHFSLAIIRACKHLHYPLLFQAKSIIEISWLFLPLDVLTFIFLKGCYESEIFYHFLSDNICSSYNTNPLKIFRTLIELSKEAALQSNGLQDLKIGEWFLSLFSLDAYFSRIVSYRLNSLS